MSEIYNDEMADKCINFVNNIIKCCTYDNFKNDYIDIMKSLNTFYKILVNEGFDSAIEYTPNSKLILGNIINIFKSIINSRKVLLISSYDLTLSSDISSVYNIMNNISIPDMKYEETINNISLNIIGFIGKIVERIISHRNDYNDRCEYDYYVVDNMCNTLINSFINDKIKEKYNLL